MVKIETRNCAICGKEFEGKTTAKYCCKECYIEAQKRIRDFKKNSYEKLRVCPVCGKSFMSKYRKYCTNECSSIAEKVVMKEYMKTYQRADKKTLVRKKSTFAELLEVSNVANKLGLSYGEYVAGVKNGKKDIPETSWLGTIKVSLKG